VVLSVALIALVLVGALRIVPIYGAKVSWYGVGADFVVALAAFFILRALVSWFAGMSAALLIALSSPFVHAARYETAVLAEGLVLLALLCVVWGWQWLERRSGSLVEALAWLALAAGSVATLALAWVLHATSGLTASLLVLSGFIIAPLFAIRRQGTSLWQVAAVITFGLLVPLAGLFAAPVLGEWVGREPANAATFAMLSDSLEIDPTGLYDIVIKFQKGRPMLLWFIIAFTLWGIWRSVRGGLILTRSRKLPLPWLLLLFTSVHLILLPTAGSPASNLPIVSCAVLLGVFGVGDFFRRIGQSLVLRPPDERTDTDQ